MHLTLALLAVAASGCSVSGRVEAEIEAALPAALGPADNYEATVEGVRLGDSTAERIDVRGDRVAREDTPVVDRLDATLWGVAFDRGNRRLSRVDSARATARLLPADLADYLAAERGLVEPRVTLSPPDRVSLRFRGEFEGIRLPGAEIAGRLRAQDGGVRMEVESVRAAGIGLGGAVARRVESRINPVLDLTDEALALTVDDVRVANGALVVRASADPTGLRLTRSW